MVRAFDCCAEHRWFEPNSRILVGMLAHCPPSSKWVPGGTTGEVQGGEERNWPPYLTMPTAQDKFPSNGHSLNIRSRTWDSPSPVLVFALFHLSTHLMFLSTVPSVVSSVNSSFFHMPCIRTSALNSSSCLVSSPYATFLLVMRC